MEDLTIFSRYNTRALPFSCMKIRAFINYNMLRMLNVNELSVCPGATLLFSHYNIRSVPLPYDIQRIHSSQIV